MEKIYNIYPADDDNILIGSAVYSSEDVENAQKQLKKLDIYSEKLRYLLIEISFEGNWHPSEQKLISIKEYNG